MTQATNEAPGVAPFGGKKGKKKKRQKKKESESDWFEVNQNETPRKWHDMNR